MTTTAQPTSTDTYRSTPGAPETGAVTPSTDFQALVSQLDLETKVRLLTGATSFTLHGEDTIGLAPMAFSDGPTGVRGLKFTGGDHVALFPNATLLASAWSEDTAHEVGEMLAEEAERQQIHVVLGPTINLHRSPWGAGSSRPTPRTRCSPGDWPRPTSRGCRARESAPASSTWWPTSPRRCATT